MIIEGASKVNDQRSVSAPNTACTGRWGLPLRGVRHLRQAFFWLRVFSAPNIVHAHPSASNASRWAAAGIV